MRAIDEYACDDQLIAQLYQQRDELLAALEQLLDCCELNMDDMEDNTREQIAACKRLLPRQREEK